MNKKSALPDDNQDTTKSNVPIELMPDLPIALWQAYDKGELVVFIGAGISRLMGCRGWEEMANDLINACCMPIMANQIISGIHDSKIKITIADRYAKKDKNKEKLFWKKFHNAIKPGKKQYDIYRDIANLGTLYITTNCDGLLVKKFPNSYTVNCTEETYVEHHTDSNKYNPYIFCIHGNYGKGSKREKETLVFTTDSYLRCYKEGGSLPHFLQRIMNDNTVLFLGYGLSEFEILGTVFKDKHHAQSAKHYMLQGFWSYEQELCNALSEYYESININLIAYCKDKKSYDQQRDIIKSWVEQLKNKTSYNSLRIKSLSQTVNNFSEEKMDLVSHAFSTRDSSGNAYIQSFYDCLSTSSECYKWICALSKEDLLAHETVPPIVYSGQSYRCPSWPLGKCIIDCLKNFHPEIPEKEILKKILRDNILVAATHDDVIKNDVAISQIIEICIRLDFAPQSEEAWLIWEEWIKDETNLLFFIQYLPTVLGWEETITSRIIKLVFSPRQNRREDGYYFERIAKIISRNNSSGLIRVTAKLCIDAVFTYSNVLFYKCFEERLSFMKGSSIEALVQSILILLSALDDITQEEYVTDLFSKARSTYTLQASLYIANSLKKGDLNYLHEPLNHSGVFVDFYIWLDTMIKSHYLFTDEQVDLLASWITNATFGYKESSLNGLSEKDKVHIQKAVNTQKYQLFQLLEKIDDQFKDNELVRLCQQSDRFSQKTPVDDLKQYYISEDISSIKYFANEDYSKCDGPKLVHVVLSKHDGSIWKNEPQELYTICEELLEIITDEQVESFICEVPKIETVKLPPFLQLFGNKKVIKRVSSQAIYNTLQQLINNINSVYDADMRVRLITPIIDCLYSLKNELANDKLLRLILDVDFQQVFVQHEKPHAEMDIVMNILNATESRLCIEAIFNAVYCKSDEVLTQKFKEWMNAALHTDNAYWIKLACAYQINKLLSIDEEWGHNDVLPLLQKDSAEIIIALCCGTRIVIPEIIEYFQSHETIRIICQELHGVNNRLIDHVITFLVAAYCFGSLDEETYTIFVQSLNDENVHHLIWSVLFGVEGNDETRQDAVLIRTYEIYTKINESSKISDAVLRYYARKEHCTVENWRFLASIASKMSNDTSNWDSFDDCLEKTATSNEFIDEVLNEFFNKKALPPDYVLKRVLLHLGNKALFEQVKQLARYAVKNNISPLQMSKYELDPESIIKDSNDK